MDTKWSLQSGKSPDSRTHNPRIDGPRTAGRALEKQMLNKRGTGEHVMGCMQKETLQEEMEVLDYEGQRFRVCTARDGNVTGRCHSNTKHKALGIRKGVLHGHKWPY